MTSSANDEWNHYELRLAIHLIEGLIRSTREEKTWQDTAERDCKTLINAIRFIEWNMRELEITGGNGD